MEVCKNPSKFLPCGSKELKISYRENKIQAYICSLEKNKNVFDQFTSSTTLSLKLRRL